jgi:hypothetical protein
VPTFADRGVLRGQRGRSPTVVNLLIYPHEAEWTPFQTHSYAKNLVAPEIEPRTSGLVVRNSDHWTTEAADNDGNNNNKCLTFSFVVFVVTVAVVVSVVVVFLYCVSSLNVCNVCCIVVLLPPG